MPPVPNVLGAAAGLLAAIDAELLAQGRPATGRSFVAEAAPVPQDCTQNYVVVLNVVPGIPGGVAPAVVTPALSWRVDVEAQISRCTAAVPDDTGNPPTLAAIAASAASVLADLAVLVEAARKFATSCSAVLITSASPSVNGDTAAATLRAQIQL